MYDGVLPCTLPQLPPPRRLGGDRPDIGQNFGGWYGNRTRVRRNVGVMTKRAGLPPPPVVKEIVCGATCAEAKAQLRARESELQADLVAILTRAAEARASRQTAARELRAEAERLEEELLEARRAQRERAANRDAAAGLRRDLESAKESAARATEAARSTRADAERWATQADGSARACAAACEARAAREAELAQLDAKCNEEEIAIAALARERDDLMREAEEAHDTSLLQRVAALESQVSRVDSVVQGAQ